uniref:Galactosylceramide sulfotransferase-like n=2 Tax=Hirondellea gigas TaxID=1518452 RepID=A0A6A7FX66_9CRUS
MLRKLVIVLVMLLFNCDVISAPVTMTPPPTTTLQVLKQEQFRNAAEKNTTKQHTEVKSVKQTMSSDMLELQIKPSVPNPTRNSTTEHVPLVTTPDDKEESVTVVKKNKKENICAPKEHIMFLKTHKCASSSIQNMFLRYGATRSLTFALPAIRNYLGNPRMFKTKLIPNNLLPSNGKVDIFAVHTRLNLEEHMKILHPDTFFVTVVREPAHLFDSLYSYFRLNNYFGVSLEDYLNYPLKKQLSSLRPRNRFGHDMMLFDMGIDVHENMTETEVRGAIEKLDKVFHLVMIAGKMDESLILLKELLCWDYSDVIFFKKNVRKNEIKSSLSKSSLEKMRKLNSRDVILYEYFLEKHEKVVLKYGKQRMAEDVSKLKNLRDKIYKECGIRIVENPEPDTEFTESSDQVNTYFVENLTDIKCVLLTLPEIQFLNKIRKDQKRKRLLEDMHIIRKRRKIPKKH